MDALSPSTTQTTLALLEFVLQNADTATLKNLVADVYGDAHNLPTVSRIRLMVRELMKANVLDSHVLGEFEALCSQAFPDVPVPSLLSSGVPTPSHLANANAYLANIESRLPGTTVEVRVG